jgi:hypothetical protein
MEVVRLPARLADEPAEHRPRVLVEQRPEHERALADTRAEPELVRGAGEVGAGDHQAAAHGGQQALRPVGRRRVLGLRQRGRLAERRRELRRRAVLRELRGERRGREPRPCAQRLGTELDDAREEPSDP